MKRTRAESAALEQDIADELASHLGHCADDLASAGLSLEAAREEARRRFGNTDTIHAACRREDLFHTHIMQQLNFAILTLLLVGLACFAMLQTHARTEARSQMAELQSELALLSASMMVIPRVDPQSTMEPVAGWVYGVGDTIKVEDAINMMRFHGSEPMTIEPDGRALFPDVGWVTVAGRTRGQVEAELRTLYLQYYAQAMPRVLLSHPRR